LGRPSRSRRRGITFQKITKSIRTIAVWVPATTRVIADAPQLRAYIAEYLDADIQTELEDQIVAGDGLGENFTGLMNVAGTQTLAPPTAPASILDNIRKAITLVRVKLAPSRTRLCSTRPMRRTSTC
jgi:HK97 family phage major capsid protein